MKIFCCNLLILISFGATAQPQYLIQFTDKAGSPYSINDPSAYLSQRAIQRRLRQHILVTESDIPINERYIDSVRSAGDVVIMTKSKWLNQIGIQTNDPSVLEKIKSFSFVKSTSQLKKKVLSDPQRKNKFQQEEKDIQFINEVNGISDFNYGASTGQIKIHNGDFLHEKGFTGQGMLIAIIDDGFYQYKTLPAFQNAMINNQVLDTYDFVKLKSSVTEEDTHGMYCFSIIAANDKGKMVGSCPDASFLLYRSEDISFESLSEEQNWVAAAERSDSAGADVITTSLGYNTFNDASANHTYADMDGKTTIIAKGAAIAASKGMILMMAAGNEGNGVWHYITTPADALNVLTVGAIDINKNIAAFSSYGPSADGRIKPEVVSVGYQTVLQTANGNYGMGNGTSFSTPNLAGLVTCLWQGFQDFTFTDVMNAVIKSSSQYLNPDNRKGYGIPDFKVAYEDLARQRFLKNAAQVLQNHKYILYPNPFSDQAQLLISVESTAPIEFLIYDLNGKLCSKQMEQFSTTGPQVVKIKRGNLSKGIYILRFKSGDELVSQKFLIH